MKSMDNTGWASGRPGRGNAFTLVELLAVIGLIIFIMGIMIAGYAVAQRSAARAKTKAVIQTLSTALDAYKEKVGYYIPQKDGMEFAISSRPSGAEVDFTDFIPYEQWKKDGTLRACTNPRSPQKGKDVVYDAFGTALWFRCPGYHNRSSYDLEAAGPDGLLCTTYTNQDQDYNAGSNSGPCTHNQYDNGAEEDNIRNW